MRKFRSHRKIYIPNDYADDNYDSYSENQARNSDLQNRKSRTEPTPSPAPFPTKNAFFNKLLDNAVKTIQIGLIAILFWSVITMWSKVFENIAKTKRGWDPSTIGGSLRLAGFISGLLFILSLSSFNLWKKIA
jgi:hypothetical protein